MSKSNERLCDDPTTIDQLFQRLSASIPQPVSELRYENSFQLLIAVILSAQATDVSVNKVTPLLFQRAPTPEKMLALGIDGIRKIIRSIGLFNVKAENIYRCAHILLRQHGGKVPATRAELEALPGVGRKTAGVVLNIAFDQPTIPVDTHVFRVANRMGIASAHSPQKTEVQLLQVVPDWAKSTAHHLLILHGRYTCKAVNPLCRSCCVSEFCQYQDKRLDRGSRNKTGGKR